MLLALMLLVGLPAAQVAGVPEYLLPSAVVVPLHSKLPPPLVTAPVPDLSTPGLRVAASLGGATLGALASAVLMPIALDQVGVPRCDFVLECGRWKWAFVGGAFVSTAGLVPLGAWAGHRQLDGQASYLATAIAGGSVALAGGALVAAGLVVAPSKASLGEGLVQAGSLVQALLAPAAAVAAAELSHRWKFDAEPTVGIGVTPVKGGGVMTVGGAW